ncbi:MAG: hypothetical protein ABWX74_02800 [Aeromicrobium sp.]
MRRVLLLVPALLVVAVAVLLVARGVSDDDRPDGGVRLTADVIPFPRSTTPLPVPEVRIGEEPWRDELSPDVARTPAPGFRQHCTSCAGTGGPLSSPPVDRAN